MAVTVESSLSTSVVLFNSEKRKPLDLWTKKVNPTSSIKKVFDELLKTSVLELAANNTSSSYISCPEKSEKLLNIRLPYLLLVVKNVKKSFNFDIQVLDDKGIRRRFKISPLQTIPRVRQQQCSIPLKLEPDWNVIKIDLPEITKKAYATTYVETLRIQIHANCRLYQVMFTDSSDVTITAMHLPKKPKN